MESKEEAPKIDLNFDAWLDNLVETKIEGMEHDGEVSPNTNAATDEVEFRSVRMNLLNEQLSPAWNKRCSILNGPVDSGTNLTVTPDKGIGLIENPPVLVKTENFSGTSKTLLKSYTTLPLYSGSSIPHSVARPCSPLIYPGTPVNLAPEKQPSKMSLSSPSPPLPVTPCPTVQNYQIVPRSLTFQTSSPIHQEIPSSAGVIGQALPGTSERLIVTEGEMSEIITEIPEMKTEMVELSKTDDEIPKTAKPFPTAFKTSSGTIFMLPLMSGMIHKSNGSHVLAVSPRPLTGTPRPPTGSLRYPSLATNSATSLSLPGSSQYFIGPSRLLFDNSQPDEAATATSIASESSSAEENILYQIAPVGYIPDPLITEAKQLYIKRTRTLFNWLYPKADKSALPQMVEDMWEALPLEEKDIYFEQVLGKDSKDWKTVRQSRSKKVKQESESEDNETKPPKQKPEKEVAASQRVSATGIIPPKLMINPHLTQGLPVPPHPDPGEKPKIPRVKMEKSPAKPRTPKIQKPPRTPRTPKNPKAPRTPRSPKPLRTFKSPKVPRTPKTPKAPRTPKSPKTPKASRTPKEKNERKPKEEKVKKERTPCKRKVLTTDLEEGQDSDLRIGSTGGEVPRVRPRAPKPEKIPRVRIPRARKSLKFPEESTERGKLIKRKYIRKMIKSKKTRTTEFSSMEELETIDTSMLFNEAKKSSAKDVNILVPLPTTKPVASRLSNAIASASETVVANIMSAIANTTSDESEFSGSSSDHDDLIDVEENETAEFEHKEIETPSSRIKLAERNVANKFEKTEEDQNQNLISVAPGSSNSKSGKAWVAMANPSLQKTRQANMPIPLRFHKDREFDSYVPTEAKALLTKSGSFMRSRRSYAPGKLDLSRFYGDSDLDDEEERVEDQENGKDRERERERFLHFMSLLAMKESGTNGNTNGLTNYPETDFEDLEEDNDPIDLVHYDPYNSLSSVSSRRQRQREDRTPSSGSTANSNGNRESGFLSPGEAISLMSSHPKNTIVNHVNPNNQNFLQPRQRQRSSQTSDLHVPRNYGSEANNLKNSNDNEGDWFEEAIPLHRHSLMRRSGGLLGQTQSFAPMLRSEHDQFEGSDYRQDPETFFNQLRQNQFPILRNSESTINSRFTKNGDDGLYSLNQLLRGAQDIDPRIPVYQRIIL